MSRETVVVLVQIYKSKHTIIHFTDTKLQGDDLWFPIYYNVSLSMASTLFLCVEPFLIINNIAINVVSVEFIRKCGATNECLVTYNVK